MNIYEIAEELKKIIENIELNDGEITEEDEKALSIADGMLENKAEGYCKLIANLKAQSEGLKNEIERLSKRKKAAENLSLRLKNSLFNAMEATSYEKLTAGTFKISFRSSETVNITNESAIDDKFCTIERKVSKTAIKEAIKAGEVVEGAEILKNKNLIIS